MVTRTPTRLAGQDCIKLETGAVAVWVTRSVGPRILGLALPGGANLLAELPGETLDCPGVGPFTFYGGHRLWHAPEDPRRTYLPDDDPLAVEDFEAGLRITQPVEVWTGIQKSLTVSLPGPDARVVVDHILHNRGESPLEIAPWAITQLRPGGLAVLPQATAPVDEHGLLPNRQIALWPYTDVRSPQLTWGNRYLFVAATMHTGKLKVGFPNPAGWLAYIVDRTLFVKYAAYQPGSVYFDGGSSSECYCDPRSIELETLGPRIGLAPGESTTHRETWVIHGGVSLSPDEAVADQVVRAQIAPKA
jgi:hypothetical protein